MEQKHAKWLYTSRINYFHKLDVRIILFMIFDDSSSAFVSSKAYRRIFPHVTWGGGSESMTIRLDESDKCVSDRRISDAANVSPFRNHVCI